MKTPVEYLTDVLEADRERTEAINARCADALEALTLRVRARANRTPLNWRWLRAVAS